MSPKKRQAAASPDAKRTAKVIERGRGRGQAAVGHDIVNVHGQSEPSSAAIVDEDGHVNPTHSVTQSATAKMAQEVVTEAIQAKRFVMSKQELHGTDLLQPGPCSGLPAYTVGDAGAVLRDGTPEAPVPAFLHCTLNVWWLDLFAGPTISSGVSRACVRDLSNLFFSTPVPWPSAFKLDVEVPNDKLPHEIAGSIVVISRMAMLWAAVFGWCELLRNDPPAKDVQRIKEAMLTAEVRIRRAHPDGSIRTLWSAHNARESIVTLGD